MLEIYEKVLGMKFVKVPSEKAAVWHPDVQMFECWDAVEDKSFYGYMYLDLFPRDNKCMGKEHIANDYRGAYNILQTHMLLASLCNLLILLKTVLMSQQLQPW